jgi:nucleoside permease NupC
MSIADKIESMLLDLEVPFERIGESTWAINDEAAHVRNVIVYVSESLLNFRVKLFELAADVPAASFRRLLEYNVAEMVHCAYGVEGNNVVIVGALAVENLDTNEFAAMLDAISLAISAHYPLLRPLFASAS